MGVGSAAAIELVAADPHGRAADSCSGVAFRAGAWRVETSWVVTAIQPQLWVNAGSSAVSFYANAFGARTVHIVGAGEDIVAQLAIGDAVFWIATAGPSRERLVPYALAGSTGRLLLVVDDPAAVQAGAVAAGGSREVPRRPRARLACGASTRPGRP